MLRGKVHWRDAVQETSTRGLDLLPRGEVLDQTSEMLLSQTADVILREMGEEYDYVIFDSAPVLVADDTASFAPKIQTACSLSCACRPRWHGCPARHWTCSMISSSEGRRCHPEPRQQQLEGIHILQLRQLLLHTESQRIGRQRQTFLIPLA